jgi:alpha-L-fucosidase
MPLGRQQLAALRRHQVPDWWRDAKLGIFVHWTPASVPAFAPVDADIGQLLQSDRSDALAFSPYAEWYQNSLRFPGSPAAMHHRDTYGARPYAEFAADWEAGLEQWDPHAWAARFAATGARYVVFVAKHSDGYCLWPTNVANPHRPGWHCRRDVVGEMAEAVRAAGMRFGLYYCGGFDWTFNTWPIGSMADVLAAIPRGSYPAYAEAQVRELIARYRPSVLWNDVAWPAPGRQLWPLLAWYYEQLPDGVVNDRWVPWHPVLAAARIKLVRRAMNALSRRQARRDGGLVPPLPPHFDYRTPEYVTFQDAPPHLWECVRGMDRSFGFNACSRAEHFIAHGELLWLLTDIVAKGGNLLLNVGPRGVDAAIPEEQLSRLDWLAQWVGTNAEAIFGTRPWTHVGTATHEGHPVRYTLRAESVYAFLADVAAAPSATPSATSSTKPSTNPSTRTSTTITLTEVRATTATQVRTMGGEPVSFRESGQGMAVDLPAGPSAAVPLVIALHNVQAR